MCNDSGEFCRYLVRAAFQGHKELYSRIFREELPAVFYGGLLRKALEEGDKTALNFSVAAFQRRNWEKISTGAFCRLGYTADELLGDYLFASEDPQWLEWAMKAYQSALKKYLLRNSPLTEGYDSISKSWMIATQHGSLAQTIRSCVRPSERR